jgi:hypothetical protein
MSLARVEAIVKATLYEGYILYPYRPSNVKNQQRWTFGGVYPSNHAAQDGGYPSCMQTECLVEGDSETEIQAYVRFLHLVRREVGELAAPVAELQTSREPTVTKVASLKVGEKVFHAWEEAIERDVTASPLTMVRLTGGVVRVPFSFAGHRALEALRDRNGLVSGVLIRTSANVQGEITIAAMKIAPTVFRLTVRIANVTNLLTTGSDPHSEAQRHAFTSTHTILNVRGGAFISLLDPPDELKEAAAACSNQGTWPVLVGEEGTADSMLSSPIILYDYPRVAPESPGDLFDATEIDEILTLRILALTDDEKRDMAAIDDRARALLERTESLTAREMVRLHGALRDRRFGVGSKGQNVSSKCPPDSRPKLASLHIGGRVLGIGDRVRLIPKRRADIMDIVLKAEVAVIEAIECDLDDQIHVAVIIEADPGREFGLDRMPGHRFFFSPDEIEPVGEDGQA